MTMSADERRRAAATNARLADDRWARPTDDRAHERAAEETERRSAGARDAEAADAATAEEAGIVANPEVSEPAANDSTGASHGATAADAPDPAPAYGAPPAWDMSGYSPPPPIRLDDHAPGVLPSGAAPWSLGWAGPEVPGVPAAAATTAPAMVSTRAAEATGRRARIQLRTSITILLFLAGIAAGVVGLRLATPVRVQTSDGFPSLERTAVEPIPAGAVAQELARNDVHGLAQLIDGDTLTAIQTQLKPLVTFESVTFVGATKQDHDTLAGYVVRGRDQDGNLGLVGLVMRLRDGQVVAQ
jgi:hypothetical protein